MLVWTPVGRRRDHGRAVGKFKGGMDLGNPQNALAAERALDRAVDLLAQVIQGWHWLDRKGKPYEAKPADNPDAFESLSMSEINWMIGTVSEQLKEDATPEGT